MSPNKTVKFACYKAAGLDSASLRHLPQCYVEQENRRKAMKLLKSISFNLSFCVFFLLSTAYAGQLEDGTAALDRKDFKKAYTLLLPLAKQGNSFAQYNVGVMLAQGLGVDKNEKDAVSWYQKAAEQGDPDAQSNLALMYESARGTKQDYKKAMEWYLKAANQGDALAQHNLGSLYYNGYGTPKDVNKTVEWYTKAAKQDLPIAQNALGAMYVQGIGVEKDPNKGLEWILKAAQQNYPEAQKNAFSIYFQEAKQGNAGAMHNVAYMCLNGWVGKQDTNECLQWYEKAANNGYASSASALAQIYEKGLFGIKADKEKANYWKKQIK